MAFVARRLIFLFFFISIVQGRILSLNSSDDHLISDGVDNEESPFTTDANVVASTPNSCNHQYGFLPCAENAAGYIFLILVYQGLLVFGEQQISSGSRVLFHIIGAEIVGGVIFRILMALPSMTLMIVSGFYSSKENAQSQVSAGVGNFAGTTVFSLTIHWATCVIFGRSKLKQGSDESGENSESNCLPGKEKLRILKDSGVRIDRHTSYTAGIMLLSLIPYVIVQLTVVFDNSSGKHIITLIALIVSAVSLLSYFAYQIRDPWMQQRSLEYTKYELRTGFLQLMQRQGQLVNAKGEPNTAVIEKLFAVTDVDGDKLITRGELETLVVHIINNGKMNIDPRFAVSEVTEIFDFDNNGCISEAEFIKGCKRWISETNQSSEKSKTSTNIFHEVAWKKLVYDNWSLITSLFQISLGVVIMNFLGAPLMLSIQQLSQAMNLSSFTISFIVIPFAMNARAALTAIFPASQRDDNAASLTFSEIYGGVIMNNISGLAALLIIVYAKDLTWNFSAEVLTILVVCAIVGILAYSSTTYPLWTSILAVILYPFSLGLMYFVQVFLNWN